MATIETEKDTVRTMCNAYAYNAALYCEGCADGIKAAIAADESPYHVWQALSEDSNIYPQGPYANGGGEADCPQHCGYCGGFLENPLTGDGEAYVRAVIRENPRGPRFWAV